MAQADPREALRHAIAYEHRLYLEGVKHEQLAVRWQERANLADRRGEQALASEALQRKAAESRLADDYRAQYLSQTHAIRRAKRGLPKPVPPAEASSIPIEARLQKLAQEDCLERDLAALKAQLAVRVGPPSA